MSYFRGRRDDHARGDISLRGVPRLGGGQRMETRFT